MSGRAHFQSGHVCGLYYNVPYHGGLQKAYLPQVEVNAHASILATTSRTVLKQTFVNPSTTKAIREVRYAFPLYEGVSVVGFSCQVGHRTIVGEVKEKEKAKEVYKDAVARGETASLFEQLPEASDVFTTTIGNIPPGAKIVINITYLGELKHDMEVDGIRFTIPTAISPRYGSVSGAHVDSIHQIDGSISITVDAEMAEGSFIQKLQSPSHPISMSMGTTSLDPDAAPTMSKASATLTLGTAHLEKDFVVQIIAKDTGIPKAILETHPKIASHRALMATLVPKFALPTEQPEIVFVCDQSGSMDGKPIKLAIQALQVFLKSLPVGVKFNICSFGSHHSFLWARSVAYSQETLNQAVQHAEGLSADYGGTKILGPLRATIENRYQDMPLEIILLTDGETWNQSSVFEYLNKEIQERKAPVRVFTLGIGNGVSHALIEGIARAGNGFSQTVGEGEKMASKVVRMLRGALSPHISDYTLEVKYSADEDDDFEIVEKVADSLKVKLELEEKSNISLDTQKKPISLFDTSADLDGVKPLANDPTGENRYAHLAQIPIPKILQAPQAIPSLFAYTRTTVYLLLGPEAPRTTPTSVILRGTSAHGPLELEIPIQILAAPGETVHQLAAKKAISELEEGRGWLASACDADGQLLKTRFDGRFSDMVEREAVRLGVQFQVGGKWCSFVATEKKSEHEPDVENMDVDWEYIEDMLHPAVDQQDSSGRTILGPRPPAIQNILMSVGGPRSARRGLRLAGLSQTNGFPSPPNPMPKKRMKKMASMAPADETSTNPDSFFGGAAARESDAMVKTLSSDSGSEIQPLSKSAADQQPETETKTWRSKRIAAMKADLNYSKRAAFSRSAPESSTSSSRQHRNARDPTPERRLASRAEAQKPQHVAPDLDLDMSTSISTSTSTSDTDASAAEDEDMAESNPPSPNHTPTSPHYTPSQPLPPTPEETLALIIKAQAFNGSFPYDHALLTALDVHIDAFKRSVSAAAVANGGDTALFTALVVLYLEERLAAFQGEWELVGEKARVWLDGVGVGLGGAEALFDAVRGLLDG